MIRRRVTLAKEWNHEATCMVDVEAGGNVISRYSRLIAVFLSLAIPVPSIRAIVDHVVAELDIH